MPRVAAAKWWFSVQSSTIQLATIATANPSTVSLPYFTFSSLIVFTSVDADVLQYVPLVLLRALGEPFAIGSADAEAADRSG